MSIYITGDTHSDYDIHKLTTDAFPEQKELTRDDYVIVAGDMGVCWDGYRQDHYIQSWYENKPWTTLFVDGNHENHAILDSLPIEEWNGGKIHRISPNIIHLMRGQVYTIDGVRIFTMGGAQSTDKEYRKENVSWWAREMPSDEEYDEAISNLSRHNNEVDIIVTHCCSDYTKARVDMKYMFNTDRLTSWFDYIENIVTYKTWYFGHYHEDKIIGDKHVCLYQQVVKVECE